MSFSVDANILLYASATLYTNDADFRRFPFLRVVNPFEALSRSCHTSDPRVPVETSATTTKTPRTEQGGRKSVPERILWNLAAKHTLTACHMMRAAYWVLGATCLRETCLRATCDVRCVTCYVRAVDRNDCNAGRPCMLQKCRRPDATTAPLLAGLSGPLFAAEDDGRMEAP